MSVESNHCEGAQDTSRRSESGRSGNHEYYAGLKQLSSLVRDAGFRVLRDRHEQAAPGLILAGVDDLTARGQFGAESRD
jgi:hypothetical protein